MRKESETTPLWPDGFEIPLRRPLSADAVADVCVVGAGIAGLSVAYRLAREGVKVVVLEAGRIGGGETERTTAHLAVALDEGWRELVRVHGKDLARLAAASHAVAIDEIESIAGAEGIDCGFERLDGWLFGAPDDPGGRVAEEHAASRQAGILGAELEARAPLPAYVTGPAIRYPGQAQFHPLRYLAGLAAAVERLGGRVYCNSRVAELAGGEAPYARTEGGRTVRARHLVVATNSPFNDRLVIHTKQTQYRTYVVGAPLSEAGETPRALYWDMDDPFHYARIAPGGRPGSEVLIVGGEDHKTGQQDDPPRTRWDRLESWARARFAGFGRVSYRWSGQIIGTNDGLAFIGRNPGDARNVYVATGDCGHGMTHGTIAGLLLPALIAGRRHPWAELYDPSRVRAGAVGTWARENLNAAAQYARHLRPGEAASVDDVAPGTGAVVRRGLSEIAAYRDADGTLVERSAVCPHLGAVVCWNSVEKTWDCPAHGSRFATDGSVLNGPAPTGLPAADAPRKRAAKKRAGSGGRGAKKRAAPRFARKTA